MQFGICHLSIVPLRSLPEDSSEMTSQLLYGDHFKVLEQRKNWSRIRMAYDNYEGWIGNNQFLSISEPDYGQIDNDRNPRYTSDLISFVSTENNSLIPLVLGSNVTSIDFFGHKFEGDCIDCKQEKIHLLDTALLYLNAPYLWGGKTPFGIDCSGLVQMVYKINGYGILRDATQQATQGDALSFIEESQPGDLAFFDNKEGIINHVGIIMKDNYIIHSHGKVRIDRLDHTGIFNTDIKSYSHKLRVIKKII
ncbi:C40 family peptidase [Flavobacteriaceae bacterium F89]|uniref:C40 family peptidase n=1 Tax=Cerina litoralis TaxID=2874477 RepID=A0AAE3EUB1_9FLAO|nr:C40 family peptidase [Cerina litoralis]MCG2459756.1 C40 family peptidase [Cerina litoralis]